MNHKKILASITALFALSSFLSAEEISMEITKRYLNLPVSQRVDRKQMTFEIDGKMEREFVIRLAENPEYWVFADVSSLKGKTVKISFPGDKTALSKVYQADTIEEQDQFYKEKNRPQIHFSTRRGWINDPNGLIHYDGEYHLFYQHNPYEREWENMHWGHAVSKDLVHWEELPEALYPDKNGTAFSGSAVIDYENVSGFGSKNNPAMVAFYTSAARDKQTQSIAYSLDKGRTWTKYEKNPIIDSKAKWNSQDTRDPKVFWYQPSKHWVMVLNERDGHSIYTSNDLKDWTYQSHTTGFWECPELFELAVDGNPSNKKWVMYGASGTYMIGSFDGKEFTPEYGKYYYTNRRAYAAQTFNNIPDSDGRRIGIAWGQINPQDMPFNGVMLLPTELTLRMTKDGVRMFSTPIKEVEKLQTKEHSWNSLDTRKANEVLHPFSDADALRIKATIKLSHATSAGFNLYGQRILDYDMNYNTINGMFYSPEDMTSMEISMDIIIDKSVIEVFIDGGAYSYSMERRPDPNNREGHHFWGNNIEVKSLKLYEMKSIWK